MTAGTLPAWESGRMRPVICLPAIPWNRGFSHASSLETHIPLVYRRLVHEAVIGPPEGPIEWVDQPRHCTPSAVATSATQWHDGKLGNCQLDTPTSGEFRHLANRDGDNGHYSLYHICDPPFVLASSVKSM